jgi:serine/threonine protein kinase
MSNKQDHQDIEKHKNEYLSDDYIIVEKIGSGSFGDVYTARYKHGGYVAAKVEDKSKPPRIYNEYKIYHYLSKLDFKVGLPKIYDFFQTPDYNIMFMQLLGPSLEDLFNKYDRKFTLSTVFMLGIQIVHLLEQLHNSKFIHRDIKPNNFLIGRNYADQQVYIMDFGLSKKYMVDGKHIKFRNKRSLIGTARYASLNMHMGMEPSRRDDLESVGYMLVYFLKGVLPWQGVKKQKNVDHIEIIGEIKMSTSLDKLCDGLPESFKMYLDYCRKLKFDEQPDYVYMKRLFEIDSSGLNIVPSYEWANNIVNNDIIPTNKS